MRAWRIGTSTDTRTPTGAKALGKPVVILETSSLSWVTRRDRSNANTSTAAKASYKPFVIVVISSLSWSTRDRRDTNTSVVAKASYKPVLVPVSAVTGSNRPGTDGRTSNEAKSRGDDVVVSSLRCRLLVAAATHNLPAVSTEAGSEAILPMVGVLLTTWWLAEVHWSVRIYWLVRVEVSLFQNASVVSIKTSLAMSARCARAIVSTWVFRPSIDVSHLQDVDVGFGALAMSAGVARLLRMIIVALLSGFQDVVVDVGFLDLSRAWLAWMSRVMVDDSLLQYVHFGLVSLARAARWGSIDGKLSGMVCAGVVIGVGIPLVRLGWAFRRDARAT